MQIREATSADTPEMVSVLRASMGEDDLPVTEEVWNFKHRDNPFGESLVLVAEENGKLIGIRAFMRWHWQRGEKLFSAFRAVDTATHPDFQGRGIFKKLTLRAVEEAKASKDHLIFNTPNDKSRPGYLKMGWKPAGKIEVAITPAFRSFLNFSKQVPDYKVTNKTNYENLKGLCDQWNSKLQKQPDFFTAKSPEYLEWRYENNPLQSYEVIATDNFYLAVFVKKRKSLKELRVVECIYRDKKTLKSVKKVLKDLQKRFHVQVISFSPKLMNLSLISIKGDFGPILTIRELNLSDKENSKFLKIDNWKYSLGDLELF